MSAAIGRIDTAKDPAQKVDFCATPETDIESLSFSTSGNEGSMESGLSFSLKG